MIIKYLKLLKKGKKLKNKNILIKAYINKNLGDDLFIKILAEKFLKQNFIIVINKKIFSNDYLNFKNLKRIKGFRILDFIIRKLKGIYIFSEIIAYKLNKCDKIIEIGGSIFMEKVGKNYHLIQRKSLKELYGKYFILGANFGPYNSNEFLEEYYNFFSECSDVCFRDIYSYSLFKNLPNIRYAKDIVFSLNVEEYAEKEYILISVIKPSIRKELFDKDNEYYNTIKNVAVDFLENGKKVKLMSFCKNEGDEEAIEEILKITPKSFRDKIGKYYYDGNIEDALEIIGKAEAVVATRFHAMILGFIYRKKVYPIAYSKKTTNVLEDLEFKGNYCSFDNLSKISYEKIMENEVLDENILELARKDAERHFEKLDLFLKEEK